jgi:class 3 adenylate cyclase
MTKSEMLLGKLLEERLTPGADIPTIDARIRAEFEEDWAVVHTNMALGREHVDSVITYLSRVHEMRRMTRPIIEACNGLVLQLITDRFIAIFKRPHDALRCLLQVHRRLSSYNQGRAHEGGIAIGAGVGYGKILKIGNEDIYGLEVSQARRLGGELAGPYEILVTDAARAALLHTPKITFEAIDRGAGFDAFEALYDLEHPDSRPPYKALDETDPG